MAEEAAGGCGECAGGEARYTCPRCRQRLCGLACYRGHGGGSCARDFASRERQLLLRGRRSDEASRRRLEEALRRLREPADEEAAEATELEAAWRQLSAAQREAFERMLRSGEIAALLPPWRPWWAPPAPRPPPLPARVPPLAALARAPPSPLLRFQLPNALFAYAYALALYRGDAGADAGAGELLPEACEAALDVSAALGAPRPFASTAEALHAALQAAAAGGYPESPLGGAGVMLAVAQLLEGFAAAALAHLAGLLRAGKRRAAAPARPRLLRAQKKCEFLLAWASEAGNAPAMAAMAAEARAAHGAHVAAAREVGVGARALEAAWGGPVPPAKAPLIEELD